MENFVLIIQVLLDVLKLLLIKVELLLFVILVFLELRDVSAAVRQSLPSKHPLSVLFLIHIPPLGLVNLGQHQNIVLLLHLILRTNHLPGNFLVKYLRVM